MALFRNRGLTDEERARLPPGSAPLRDFPCRQPARSPTSRPPPDWDFRVFGAVERPRGLELGRASGRSPRAAWDHGHALRHDLEQAGHGVGGRARCGRSWRSWGSAPRRPTPSPTPRRTTPRTSRSSGSAPTTSSWRTASTGPRPARAGPRRAASAAGAQPLLLEERQVAARASGWSGAIGPGYWERLGYSNSADPWKEERYGF